MCPVGRLCNKQGAEKHFWLVYLIFLSLKLSPFSCLTGHFSDDKVAFYKVVCHLALHSPVLECLSTWKFIEKNEEGPTYFTAVLSFGQVKWLQCSITTGAYKRSL